MVFYIKQATTRANRLGNARGQRGTPRGMLSGSWISDLAALKKAIVLCDMCARKWNPAKAGYVSKRLWPGAPDHVVGDCDSCGTMGRGTLYTSEGG